jgi:ArsR family transcriptional regulator
MKSRAPTPKAGRASDVFKALGNPARVRIVRELADEEKCVCHLVDAVGLGWSTVSRHLSVLRDAGILTSDKRGVQIYYQLALPCVAGFLDCLENPSRYPSLTKAKCCA